MIAVVVHVDSIEAGWLVGRARAVAADDTAESTVTLNQDRLSDSVWLHAQSSGRYLVSAQLETTRVPSHQSPWTADMELKVPPAPSVAPQAPAALRAEPAAPYAIHLTWQDHSRDEHGFAIERAGSGNPTFIRVGILQTNVTSWTHRGLAPNDSGMYRVVSFNAVGVSTASEPVAVATIADVSRAAAYAERGATKDSLSACLTGDIDLEHTEGALSGEPPRHYRNIPFGRHSVDMVVDLCGNANCSVSLYATLRGCKRRIGDSFFVPGDSAHPGRTVRAVDGEGWPVIVTIGHSS